MDTPDPTERSMRRAEAPTIHGLLVRRIFMLDELQQRVSAIEEKLYQIRGYL